MSQQAERALNLLAARSEDQGERPIGGAALAQPSSHERRELVTSVLSAFASTPPSAVGQLGLAGAFGG